MPISTVMFSAAVVFFAPVNALTTKANFTPTQGQINLAASVEGLLNELAPQMEKDNYNPNEHLALLRQFHEKIAGFCRKGEITRPQFNHLAGLIQVQNAERRKRGNQIKLFMFGLRKIQALGNSMNHANYSPSVHKAGLSEIQDEVHPCFKDGRLTGRQADDLYRYIEGEQAKRRSVQNRMDRAMAQRVLRV